jgi:hypothetical protein
VPDHSLVRRGFSTQSRYRFAIIICQIRYWTAFVVEAYTRSTMSAEQGGTPPYNTPDFTVRIPPNLGALGATLAAKVGLPAPEIETQRLDGGAFRLSEARQGRHVVLLTGAITSPMSVAHLAEMTALAKEFERENIDFYLLYVKESHPAENFLHHTSLQQKTEYARDFERLEKPGFPILVDSLEGDVHRAYGAWPSALFVIQSSGMLIFRSTIADPVQLRTYLTQLVGWDRIRREHPDHVQHICYTESLVEVSADEASHYRVYHRAGQKAFEDYWRVHPVHHDIWPGPEKV